MAISKERLEELIEQGATIWCSFCEKEINLNPSCKIVYYTRSINDYDVFILNIIKDNENIETRLLEDLFETEEEAKFALEFQNVPKTKYLNLPFWDEIKISKGKPFTYHFDSDKYLFVSCLIIEVGENDKNGEQVEQYFVADATKENYLKACSICKQLFLKGEVK